MARKPRPIDSTAPAAELAGALRLLRQENGFTLRQLAERAGYAPSTLAAAESGAKIPTWYVVEAYVQACGGDPADWRERWESCGPGQEKEPVSPPPSDTAAADDGHWSSRRTAWLLTAGVAAVVISVGVAAYLMGSRAGHGATQTQGLHIPAKDGEDPYYQAACGKDQRLLDQRPMKWPDGSPYGKVALYYSASCRAAWGYVYGPNSRRWSVHIVAHRDSDHAQAPSQVSADIRPNSWGNALSTDGGCVSIEAYVVKGGIRGPSAATECIATTGTVSHG